MIISYTTILACIGLALSLYAYNIENRIKQNAQNATADSSTIYKPSCDLSERISCSKPILSPYGSLFTISNSIIGMILYSAILLSTLLGIHKIVFVLSLFACIMSLGFAYVLFFKIKVLCLVCVSIYIINALLLWASWPSII